VIILALTAPAGRGSKKHRTLWATTNDDEERR
jgi:hypothetical protein